MMVGPDCAHVANQTVGECFASYYFLSVVLSCAWKNGIKWCSQDITMRSTEQRIKSPQLEQMLWLRTFAMWRWSDAYPGRFICGQHPTGGERTFKQNSQYSRAIKALTESEEKLDATLSKEQKSLLNDYRYAQQELMVITDCETFIRGFQIGAKIMLDVLTEGKVKEL